jgi:tetratricopeptide (TPR) repeat protein
MRVSRYVAAATVVVLGFGTEVAQGQVVVGDGSKVDSTLPARDVGESSARQKAKLLYEEGLVAYRAGRYSDAIDKLLEADKVMPNAAFSYNIALVYEAMGNSRSALRWLRCHLRQVGDEKSNVNVLAKIAKFEKALQAQGIQQLTVVSKPNGATVWIDGHVLGMSPFTTELVPGNHSVSLTLDGYEPAQKTFELRTDRALDVEVELTAKRETTPTTAPLASQSTVFFAPTQSTLSLQGSVKLEAPSSRPIAQVKPWTWIGLGLGAALFGGAIGFEVKRRSEEDDARTALAQKNRNDYVSHWDAMDSSMKTARVLLVAGSVTTVVGLTLLTFDLRRSRHLQTASIEGCESHGICATAGGQF